MIAPIAVALDAPTLDDACQWAAATSPHVAYLKIGLESYLRYGADGVRTIFAACPSENRPELFLDLKLHDIPNTVAGGARAVGDLAPSLLTVHALGGPEMVAAAAAALPDTRIAAVTILTSMSAATLDTVGILGPPLTAAVRLAVMAVEAGARALVCSPMEVADIRRAVPDDVVLITPGVRPAGEETHDQHRVSTPEAALAAGADILVIGRPITRAGDPGMAAQKISASLIGNR